MEKPVHLRSVALDLAGFVHAFFTRRAGDAFAPQTVDAAARALGVEPLRLYLVKQVHGRDVHVTDDCDDRERLARTPGDALVAARLGDACAVRVADCVPLLVADRRSGAVAAVHSGWKGTVANITDAAITRLRAALGGPGDMVAAIGPHIQACCFEVGEDVAERLEAAPGGHGSVDRSAARPHASLRRIVRAQLEILDVEVDDVYGCTVCEEESFYSYRRDREKSGRMLAAIAVRAR